MTGYSAKSIDELPTLWDGFAKLVRAGLDITAFGANIMDLPPDYSTTSHDEAESGQQELYVALRGSGSVDIDGRPPATRRRPSGAGRRRDRPSAVVRAGRPARALHRRRPGGVYEPPEWSSAGGLNEQPGGRRRRPPGTADPRYHGSWQRLSGARLLRRLHRLPRVRRTNDACNRGPHVGPLRR